MSQEYRDKVVPYVIPGTSQEEVVDGITYQIRNTRQEETFRQFQSPNSPQSELCDVTSEDDILRLFFFIKPDFSIHPVEEFPLVLGFPLFLDFDEKFLGFVFDESVKKKIDGMKDKSEEVEKSLKEISSKMLWKFFTVAVSDRQVSSRLQRKRGHVKEQEVDDLVSGLMTRRKNQFDSLMADWVNVFSSLYYAQEYSLPIVQAYQSLDTAKETLDILSNSVIVMDLAEALRSSLSKLISRRICRMRIESICLECYLRKGVEPYTMIQKYPLEPTLDAICNKCGGKSIYHVIKMEAPYSLGPLFQENTLQEFIIGYTLAKSEVIKKLYVHKKVNVLAKEGPSSGVQINIFAITKNNRILLVDVTTSKNLNKVMKDVDAKIDALRGFPYDMLVFITPSVELKEYLDYHKVRVFGSRHLQKIVSHIGYLLDEYEKTSAQKPIPTQQPTLGEEPSQNLK